MSDRQGIPPTARHYPHSRPAAARAVTGTPPVPYGYALLITLGGLLDLALAWASHLSR